MKVVTRSPSGDLPAPGFVQAGCRLGQSLPAWPWSVLRILLAYGFPLFPGWWPMFTLHYRRFLTCVKPGPGRAQSARTLLAQAAGLPWRTWPAPLGLGAVALEARVAPSMLLPPEVAKGITRLPAGAWPSGRCPRCGAPIPPDGKAQEHGVVLVHVFPPGRRWQDAGGVVHLDGAAALLLVSPGRQRCRGRQGGSHTGRPHGLGDGAGSPGGGAAGGEIGHRIRFDIGMLLSQAGGPLPPPAGM